MNSLDALELLELDDDFTAEDLKKAYRRESKYWHPDVCADPDAAFMFTQMGEARTVLEKRLERRQKPKPGGRRQRAEPFSRFRAPQGQAEDLASALFGDGPDLSGMFCVRDMVGDRCDCVECAKRNAFRSEVADLLEDMT